jgi:hypothetical protein
VQDVHDDVALGGEGLQVKEVPKRMGVVAARKNDERVFGGGIGEEWFVPRLLHVGKHGVAGFPVRILVVRARIVRGGRVHDEQHHGNAGSGLRAEQFLVEWDIHTERGDGRGVDENVCEVLRAVGGNLAVHEIEHRLRVRLGPGLEVGGGDGEGAGRDGFEFHAGELGTG